ncbi:MAG: copper resistance protein CopC [Chloroflexi bacterium]|nr:copper resistance protein CopC [Chloroflexota bacterium]MCI0577419.1 copper resistance protein CopC [Chloroflexota bacterium]MCI0649595.1 copper resistance protein CopC [Chloroflexota bacterium]MCI0725363.1 copper resistance protein CopC [Chloroflexota bacterium]
MKQRLTPFTLFLICLFLAAALAGPVSAHASLLQSVPEANATVERSPVQIELFFSEPVEESFSSIQVLDGTGKRVDNDDPRVDSADPTHLTVSLRSLPDGVYTVSWRALSSVDSHITAGAFPFAVGNVDAAELAAAAQASRQIKLSPGEMVVRWLTYLAGMVLAGNALFVLLVWQPAVRLSGAGENVQPAWPWLARLFLVVLAVANIFWLLVQAGQASGAEIAAPWQKAVTQVLFTTRFGALWLGRIALALALVWLLPQTRSSRERWLVFAAALLLLLTISLGSHAAAQPEAFLPVLADWLHLAAASVWVGGLAHFLAGLYAIRSLDPIGRTRLTAGLIPRFSALALVSVSALILTGLYAAVLHLGTLEALTGTIYGRTLIVKLALVLPMLMLGAINLLVTSPRMRLAAGQGSVSLVDRFRRLVTGEVTLGVAVLLSVGVLTTLPPARVATAAPMLNGTQVVDDLEITLDVTPGRPGINTFLVTLRSGGQPVNNAREVSLQFTPATADLPPSEAQLTARGNGEYQIEGGFLALPDAWQLQVAVRRENAFDAFANFNFSLGTTAPIQSFPWHRVTGVLLLAAGLAYLFALKSLVKGRGPAVAYAGAPATLLIAAGALVFFRPPIQDQAALVNPIPPNADSLATGQALYEERCLPCHGPTGAGDGPVGRTLNPPPADLTRHTAPGVHPDSRLYNWITNGFPDSVMPAFKDTLSDEERWHLVNYIRTLAQ